MAGRTDGWLKEQKVGRLLLPSACITVRIFALRDTIRDLCPGPIRKARNRYFDRHEAQFTDHRGVRIARNIDRNERSDRFRRSFYAVRAFVSCIRPAERRAVGAHRTARIVPCFFTVRLTISASNIAHFAVKNNAARRAARRTVRGLRREKWISAGSRT